MRRIGAVIVLLACSRREDPTLTSAKLEAGASDVRQMAQQWNRALATRDSTLVAQIYGSRTMFYGAPLRHDEVVRVQVAAFDGDQSFTQEIEKVHVTGSRVDFDRKWTRFGKMHKDHASLDGTVEGGKWVV